MVGFGRDEIFFYHVQVDVVKTFRRFWVSHRPCRISLGFEVREVIVLPELIVPKTHTGNSERTRVRGHFGGRRSSYSGTYLARMSWDARADSSLNFDALFIFLSDTHLIICIIFDFKVKSRDSSVSVHSVAVGTVGSVARLVAYVRSLDICWKRKSCF